MLLRVLASSLLAEETLSNSSKTGNFELAIYNLDKTNLTFENNSATTESCSTSEAEGSTSTLGIGKVYCQTSLAVLTFLVSNPVLFKEGKDDSLRGTLLLKFKQKENYVTSSN